MAKVYKAKKKKGTYDNPKLFILVTVSLAVIIAIITIASLVIHSSGNYVAKVNGNKILDYEYEYFLYIELSKMQADIDVEGLAEDKAAEKYKEFWTTKDENGVYPDEKAKDNALEEARQFKASYELAVKNGHKMSREKKGIIKSNIDNTIATYMNYYAQMGYQVTREQMIKDLCATMSLNEYKDYMVQLSAIQEYKESLKETYEISEEEIKSIFEEDRDRYRFIDVRLLYLNAVNEEKEKMSTEEYKALLEEANKIAESFNETGKYEDKGFVEYIKENTDDSSKDGFYTINKDSYEHRSKKINEFAYKLEQTDLSNDGISAYTVIEDEDLGGIFIVIGEKIVDLDTPVPEKKEDETLADENSSKDIKDKIIAERKEEMATEEVKKAVSGSDYSISSIKEKTIQKYVDDWDLKKP